MMVGDRATIGSNTRSEELLGPRYRRNRDR
jgi:hypothetical protein